MYVGWREDLAKLGYNHQGFRPEHGSPSIFNLKTCHFNGDCIESAIEFRYHTPARLFPENPEQKKCLIRVAAEHPELLSEVMRQRPLLVETLSASRKALQLELDKEQAAEREKDQQYWRPLIKELEAM